VYETHRRSFHPSFRASQVKKDHPGYLYIPPLTCMLKGGSNGKSYSSELSAKVIENLDPLISVPFVGNDFSPAILQSPVHTGFCCSALTAQIIGAVVNRPLNPYAVTPLHVAINI
jgi:hypothetical protein